MRTLVEDVMSTDVAAVEATTAVETVAQVLDARKISAVPVVDRDNLVLGVVSEVDVLRHRFTGRSASDVMSTPAVTIRPDQPAAVAAQRMDRHGIKRLPVVDDLGRLVGIISRGDLVRVLARGDRLQAGGT